MQKTRKVVRARVGLVEDWQYMIELIWLLRTRVWFEVESIDDWRPPDWGLNWGLRLIVSIISFNPFSPTNKFGAFAAVYFLVTFDIRIKITQTRMYGFPVQPLTSHTNNSKKKKLSICKLGTSPTNKRHYWTWHPQFFFVAWKMFFFHNRRKKKSCIFARTP